MFLLYNISKLSFPQKAPVKCFHIDGTLEKSKNEEPGPLGNLLATSEVGIFKREESSIIRLAHDGERSRTINSG